MHREGTVIQQTCFLSVHYNRAFEVAKVAECAPTQMRKTEVLINVKALLYLLGIASMLLNASKCLKCFQMLVTDAKYATKSQQVYISLASGYGPLETPMSD